MSPSTSRQTTLTVRDAPSPPKGAPIFSLCLRPSTRPGHPMTPEDRQRPGQIRRLGRAHASLWGFSSFGDAVSLCLSELVTNAFLHGEGNVGVRMWCTNTQIHIEVSSSTGRQQMPLCPREVDLLDESGRGLMLVDAYADSWGVVEDGSLNRTWCVFALGGGR
ncbi:ATP-binding protein [Streptomyces albipurpureus]|uniref:ATP-binding protein n=1 Tax=Streptomyces albipurpureus TaxID=2897419 RepID=UPI003CE4EA9E